MVLPVGGDWRVGRIPRGKNGRIMGASHACEQHCGKDSPVQPEKANRRESSCCNPTTLGARDKDAPRMGHPVVPWQSHGRFCCRDGIVFSLIRPLSAVSRREAAKVAQGETLGMSFSKKIPPRRGESNPGNEQRRHSCNCSEGWPHSAIPAAWVGAFKFQVQQLS